jgi:uncharacterized protein (DUF2344 family)
MVEQMKKIADVFLRDILPVEYFRPGPQATGANAIAVGPSSSPAVILR